MNPVEYYKSLGWRVTSPYGNRTGQFAGFHRGVDFGGHPCGAVVRTPYAGKVVAARTSGMGTWGNTVCIELAPDGQYVSLNAHLQSIRVREGQEVKAGDIIGTNGGTNHSGADYACHIHYEVQVNNGTAPWRGTLINPAEFFLDQTPQEPSKRFQAGQIIVATANVNVRERPTTTSKITGRVEQGGRVKIKSHNDNGKKQGGYAWWNIHGGWVAEPFFNLLQEPDPEPIEPPELEQELKEKLMNLYLALKDLYEMGVIR